MTRESRRGVFLRRSPGWIAAGFGALIALGTAALFGLPGSDTDAVRPAESTNPEIPALHLPTPPELRRATRDAPVPVEPRLRLPREHEPILLKQEPAAKPRVPEENERAAPGIAPLPAVDPKPVLAQAPRERRLGPESMISPDIGEGHLLVTPTRDQQLAGLLEPAQPAAEEEPETPSVSAAPPRPDPSPIAASRSQVVDAPVELARADTAPAPTVAVFEPRATSVAIAPAELAHIDLGKADLLERLPKLEPIVRPQDEPTLTLLPANQVSNVPPPVSVPWLDPAEVLVTDEPTPQVSGLPAFAPRKAFRDRLRQTRNRVLDTMAARSTPEPGTAALLALGLTWIALRRRR